ncbi:hypothetical protein BJY21_001389 [Kineosphaera limosa]|uniref:Uncharacterized protein n=1 Tax=Kineosphaera limosa NBRC 100340 TaxID=1184609 RepID=K6XH34_9MICO|nr:hypothetical protein [Kineosphaera limosa]NYE00205.1 hypothetical protein [Kineosphaera limosa]GAB98154.1 hypothetical protein KILIM_106_00030 [Kineosphaera limosa NBRC 100340]
MTAVDLQVVAEHGQWAVYLVRVDEAGAGRDLLRCFRSQREAEVFADAARRSAYRRSLPDPSGAPMRRTTQADTDPLGPEGDRQ